MDTRSVDLDYFSPQRVLKQYYHEAVFYLQCDGLLLVLLKPDQEFRLSPIEVHRWPLPPDAFIEISQYGAAVIERSGKVTMVHLVPGALFDYYRQQTLTIENWTNKLVDTSGTSFYFLGVGKEVLTLLPSFTGPGIKYTRFTVNSNIRLV